MTIEEEMILHFTLLKNATDYWYDVDHNYGLNTSDYFLEDAQFFDLKGREAIQQFYLWRKSRGARTARHLITNFRARLVEPGLAHTNYVMLLYAADGEPVLPSAAPIQISEQEDVCVLCDDGKWRYRARRFVPIFAGGAPATVPPADWYEKHSPADR